ncbi:MAG: FAD-dependent oxidoreductase [Gammaproteobacteria bacterium]|nr:FAD-dependent oxidoreductase [Gammaproteobacteria bacterium]
MYDLAVIGGGIQGVGVAQAAAAAGYSVILFEQDGLASGTSSRSSKLIHGGLRYLESGQFSLVRKALLERALLLKLAPELVKLVPFYIPVYPETSRRSWQIRAGLSLYAMLGNFTHDARFTKLDRDTVSGLELKNTTSLQAVYRYFDAQTDDKALTRSVMQSAMELGAELVCPARVIQITHQQHQFAIAYQQQDQEKECQCKVVVNAAGPWVNRVLDSVSPEVPKLEMDLVQGTHIVLSQPAPNGIYYVEAPQDRRAVFVMPWQGGTMVGTTETPFLGDPANSKPLDDEIEYLLEVYGHYFDGQDEMTGSFSGLRVLPRTNHHYFHRPRDTILYQHASLESLLTLYGGKLTGYRATALQVLKQLRPILPARKPIADTAKLMLNPVSSSFN